MRAAFEKLQAGNNAMAVAVRSSATAEDLPDASFAGQQETHLNIVGVENVLHAMRDVLPRSLTIAPSPTATIQGYDHHKVALSAGVQRMVRSKPPQAV